MKNCVFYRLVSGFVVASVFLGVAAASLSAQDVGRYLRWRRDASGTGAVVTGVDLSFSELTIPAEIDGFPVTEIGGTAFLGDLRLKSAALPETLKKIGFIAFHGCENLERINVPASVVEIHSGAFEGCPRLKLDEIFRAHPIFGAVPVKTLDPTATSDGYLWYERKGDHIAIRKLFSDCESFSIPAEIEGTPVTEIDSSAFFCRKALKSVALPDGIATIGDDAFTGCENLETLSLPSSVSAIGTGAFLLCDKLDLGAALENVANFSAVPLREASNDSSADGWVWYEKDGGTAVVRGVCGSATDATIPSELGGLRVVAISDKVFGVLRLQTIAIPEGVERIGGRAFFYLKNLKKVSLPSTLKSIGPDAFYGCETLVSAPIPASVEEIAPGAFRECVALNLADALKDNARFDAVAARNFAPQNSPGGYVWYEKNDGRIVARGVTYKGAVGGLRAHDGVVLFDVPAAASSYVRLVVPESIDGAPVTEIGVGAFELLADITSVEIPEGVEKIDENAFKGCSRVMSAKLPESLKSIGSEAFAVSRLLDEVALPSGIVEIGSNVFSGRTRLKARSGSATAKTLSDAGYLFDEIP